MVKKYGLNYISSINLDKNDIKYDNNINSKQIEIKYFPKKNKSILNYTSEISNTTNCLDGKFHNFVLKDSKLECVNCGFKYGNDKEEDYFNNYYNYYIHRLLKNLCKQKIIKQSKYKKLSNDCSLDKNTINEKSLNEINNIVEDINNSNIKNTINKYAREKQKN